VKHPLWGIVPPVLGFVVWVCAWAEVTRAIPGPLGILVASWWPIPLFLVVGALIWWRAGRYERRLIDEEFRDT
jgi:hypothetical protein